MIAPKDRSPQLKYYHKNREQRAQKMRDWTLRSKYGIDLVEYEKMFVKQNGQCAICFKNPARGTLAVDHDHETGVVRGLLCENCNKGIGHYHDNPLLLRRAAAYLEGR